MQRTEHDRVCFGRSGIHGWGLFARRDIQEGEMVQNLNIELHVLLKSYYVVKFMFLRSYSVMLKHVSGSGS